MASLIGLVDFLDKKSIKTQPLNQFKVKNILFGSLKKREHIKTLT